MSYAPTPVHSYPQSPQLPQAYYSSTPPAPPPKPSAAGTPNPNQGPPLPPPPPGQHQNEPSELDGGQTYPQNYNQQQYLHQQEQPQLPSIEPGWLPDTLRDKTTTDLHAILNDPSLQTALITNPSTAHPSLAASESHLTPLVQQNAHLSTHLLTLEHNLTQKRQETQSRLLALRALEQSHRSKIAETEKALQQFSPMALYQRLSASVVEQEQLVRGMEESWLDGREGEGVEVGEFLKRVREARRVGLLREERRGRWDEGRVGGWR